MAVKSRIVTQEYKRSFFSKRKQEKEKFNIWMTSTYVSLLWIIALLLLYYVWTLNVNATKWYNIRQLEIEKQNLLMEKEQLDVKIAELESLNNIMNSWGVENMEKIEEPDYLVIKDNTQYVFNY